MTHGFYCTPKLFVVSNADIYKVLCNGDSLRKQATQQYGHTVRENNRTS